MQTIDPDWTAPPTGQDWRDDELMLAVTWLKSFVPRSDMERRIDAVKAYLASSRERMREGVQAPLYDPADTVAWYILQAETYATDRAYWSPEGVMRVVPFLTRIGKELPLLLTVKGVEERADRTMLAERRQPDGSIFELLVALAYRRGGWERVEFVQETPGRGRTPDLHVFRPRSRWAVECKRLAPSPYAAREKLRGMKLADPVHALSLEMGISVVVEVMYKIELADVPEDYLVVLVQGAIKKISASNWDDEISKGRVKPVNWPLARKVLAKDDVYFGASRMIELLVGYYVHEADHSMAAKWRPAPSRPSYAQAVYQASVVSWRSQSRAAVRQKARHFRSTLANAEGQLPPDRPGVIHIGVETYAGANVDLARHIFNTFEARSFAPSKSRLRWVYGNYFVPEATTRKDESWAITETMVPYRIGSHRTRWPLPGHMLVSPEGEGRQGVHWSEESD
ncbi:hypothetical protein [Mesorhizobium sp. LNJC403B00]|uniref:hypothetical protein n=1 Tax=Mesorhizobium sp. LNJC403B00 TaxID=1287280 RepID=UPI0003CEBBFF|nr:hypothetical protein [Mesorhizobium sp. LNJC403B00]ESX91654.1 hypothetical protein X754_23480 [Mesorhizobium sp. LNJC403B00]